MNKRGFTLVELMVVIVVIAILAGIVVLSYSGWRTETAQNEVQNDLKAAATAMENYKNFNNGYPATLSTIGSSFTPSQNVTVVTSGTPTTTYYCLKGSSTAVTSVIYYITSTNQIPHTGSC